jgi:hypothetical protein
MKNIIAHSNRSIFPLLLTALLGICGCSSTPDFTTMPTPPLPAPANPAAPIFLGTGASAVAASGVVRVDAIDYTNRTCLLSRPDGETMLFKVGPEYPNFDQIKVGDSFLTTVSKTYVVFLTKGGVPPSSETNYVASTMPAGAQPGGVMIQTMDYHAKILVLNNETRQVVLQYGKGEAQEVQAGPDVNLQAVHVNDDVLIRVTEAIAIAVAPPPGP